MYKTLMLSLVLLASAAWLQAQAGGYSQPSQSSGSASGHMTVQGCLQGSDGNYTLTADDGTMYQLTGNTSDLSAHVGHEVQISGTTSASSMSGSSRASTPEGTQQATLDVKSMKHISKTCKAAAK